MSNPQAAALIAKHLPSGLPHPGNPQQNQPPQLIQFPGFRTTGMPAELAHSINQTAQHISEAIINLLETEGHYQISPAKPQTSSEDGNHIIRCNQCQQMLFAVPPDGVNPKLFLHHIKQIEHNCDES